MSDAQRLMIEIEMTPSSFEKTERSEKSADEEGVVLLGKEDLADSAAESGEQGSEESAEASRPKGNIFGNVMHRSFELVIESWKKDLSQPPSLQETDRLIRRAIMENASDISSSASGFEKAAGEYSSFLKDVMDKFIKDPYILQLFSSADGPEGIHPEYPFEVTASFADIRDLSCGKELSAQFDNITDDTRVYLHGISDLVVEKQDGGIAIIDFKSDIKRQQESLEDFEKRLYQKYQGQLSLYEFAMKRAFGGGTPVTSELYHLYRP